MLYSDYHLVDSLGDISVCEKAAVMDALITTPKNVGGTWSVSARSEGRHDADCEC